MRATLRSVGAPLLLWMLAACDPLPPAADAALVDAAVRGPDAWAADASVRACDGAPLACEDLTPDPSCADRWVVGVQGQVTRASDGAAVEGARPQLCLRVSPEGALVCLMPPSTAADGTFTILVPAPVRCMQEAAMRVLSPGQPYATTYCHVALGADAAIVGLTEPFELFGVETASVPPRGDGSASRTIAFGGGLALDLAPDAFADPADYSALASGRFDALPCGLDAGVIAAWAFSPEVRLEGGAGIAIEDGLGLAAGAEVDLVIVGGLETRLSDGTPVAEAAIGVIGTGRVSSDGARIETSARLPYLSWLGVRAR